MTRPNKCSKNVLGTMYPGILTSGTDQPVYPPWYMGDNPASGEGYEAAVAYAVADNMSGCPSTPLWLLGQRRSTPTCLSSRPPNVTQAVVTVKSSPAPTAKTVHELRTLRLGVQVGTTTATPKWR
jgi:polar amino acid transport system substrate-binding protein